MELNGLSDLLGISNPWVLMDIKTQPKNKVIDVFIDFERGSKFPCSVCGKQTAVYDSSYKRIRYLDLFDYRCYLNIKTPRLNCNKDGVKVAHVDKWSRKSSHYSVKFEALSIRLCKEMSMKAVSVELGEPDNNLWRVFNYYVNIKIKNSLDLQSVKRVCVDETATKRGHNYVSIFTDYDTGTVIYVVEGRKKEVFSMFYGWLWDHGGHPGEIELFSMDMSKSYQAGKREYFASAQVVFDRFHIKKGLNEAINTVRKNEVQTVDELKKTKYIWLKNEKNLTENQKKTLEEFLVDCSLDTVKAFQLKSGFDHLWKVQSLAIEPLMESWIEKALRLNLKPINRFVKSVKNNINGIMNAIKTGITNAVSEGLNSVMQLARSRARGFRNIDNFCNMIYFLGNH